MKFRDYIVSAVILVGVGALSVVAMSVDTARADLVRPYQDPRFEAKLVQLIDGQLSLPIDTPPPPGSFWGKIYAAGDDGGRFPWLAKATGVVLLGPTAFDVGLKIGRTIDNVFFHAKEPNICIPGSLVMSFFGCAKLPDQSGSISPLANKEWTVPLTTIQGSGLATGRYEELQLGMVSGGGSVTFCSSLSGDVGPRKSIGSANVERGQVFWAGNVSSSLDTAHGTGHCYDQIINFDMQVGGTVWTVALASGYQSVQVASNDACFTLANGGGSESFTGTCYVLYKNDSHDEDTKKLINAPATNPFSGTGDINYSMPSPGADTNPTPAEWTAIRTAIGGDTNTRDWVDCILDPGEYTCPTGAPPKPKPPFQLPEPGTTETYGSYQARLRELGYLGHITFLDDQQYPGGSETPYPTNSDALNLDPESITRVAVGTITGPGSVPIYDPSTGQHNEWDPATAPLVVPGSTTEVAIRKVPDDYTPPSGGGGGSKCKTPTLPALDFTPLTALDFGSKFPFGVFTWITTVYGYFNVTPVAPEVNIDLGSLGTDFLGGTYVLQYDVSLSGFSTYMGTIRTLISFALWVGAIWYIGVTLLGFRGGGDVSDAADEGFDA